MCGRCGGLLRRWDHDERVCIRCDVFWPTDRGPWRPPAAAAALGLPVMSLAALLARAAEAPYRAA